MSLAQPLSFKAPPPPAPERRRRRAPRGAARPPTPAARPVSPHFLALGAAATDFTAILAAAYFASMAYHRLEFGKDPFNASTLGVGLIVALFAILARLQSGAYALDRLRTRAGLVRDCLSLWNLAFCVALVIAFATKTSVEISRGSTALFYALGLAGFVGSRLLSVRAAGRLGARDLVVKRRIVVVGFEAMVREQVSRIDAGRNDLSVLDSIALRDDPAWLNDDLLLAAAAIRVTRPDDILLAVPWTRQAVIERALDVLIRTPAQIHVAGDSAFRRFESARQGPDLLRDSVKLTAPKATLWRRVEKRAFDFSLSALALLALSPVLLAIALLVWLETRGAVLFKQTRYGFNQEPFAILKFRTMRAAEEPASEWAADNHSRITPVGALLRRLRLDELPQFINLVRGEMNLVGPRPHPVSNFNLFNARIPFYGLRCMVRPGLTGWAQVRYRYANNLAEETEKMRYDLYYIKHRSVWLDLKIIPATLLAVLAGRGATSTSAAEDAALGPVLAPPLTLPPPLPASTRGRLDWVPGAGVHKRRLAALQAER